MIQFFDSTWMLDIRGVYRFGLESILLVVASARNMYSDNLNPAKVKL